MLHNDRIMRCYNCYNYDSTAAVDTHSTPARCATTILRYGFLGGLLHCGLNKQSVRVATQYAPPLSSPRGRPNASRAAEQTQRSNTFPRRIRSHVTAAAILRVKAALSKAACTLTFDLLTLKVVSESHVTWAIAVPILVFLGLSVLDLGPM